MKFDVIYADPAWQYNVNKGHQTRDAANQYMVTPLKTMKEFKVDELASKDSLLFMWVTYPTLKEGLELMESWGFKYITNAFTWVKRSKKYDPLKDGPDKFFFGLGYYTRGNAEICLLGKKGKGLKILDKSVEQITISPIGSHSEKPHIIYDKITRLVGTDCSKVELFARNTKDGWTSLGNEIDGKDLADSIPELIAKDNND